MTTGNEYVYLASQDHGTSGYRPVLTVAHAAGWANVAKVNGVVSSSIGKVDGTAVASIAKVNGVSV